MPSSNYFDVLRLVLGLFLLGVASFSDIRTRKVSNQLWFGMLTIGLIVMVGDLISSDAEMVLLLTPIPVAIFFVAIFTEGELSEKIPSKANIILTLVLIVVAVAVLWYEGEALAYDARWIGVIHIPIMLFLAYLFYGVRLLHGGADAKALMGLSVLVPFYPVLEGLPIIEVPEAMTLLLPFTFVVLVNSALVTLLVPLGYAVFNASRGDMDGRMFFGYRLPLKDVERRHVWLMEKVRDGEVVTFLLPKRDERKDLKRELRDLRKAGVKKVWVNPKIPFMVPMFFGFLITFLVGNLIFGFIGRLMGV